MIRVVPFLLLGAITLAAQPQPDPAYAPLAIAYEALKGREYETAVANFEEAIRKSPKRSDIRKDLAYTLLKIGETEAARDQFGEAMKLDLKDEHVVMEYAFLCYETKKQALARRIFNRIRKTGNATAEHAFQNIDRPLADGIERWKRALEANPDNFSGHEELAMLAEQRDELAMAAEHYEKALRLRPEMRVHLLNLGRVWKELGDEAKANTFLLAASRAPEARIAETARELLPSRYPYVYEFRNSLAIDPRNVDLQRELAYLLLAMGDKPAAEQEFQALNRLTPDDLLTAAQLGFLRLARKDMAGAMPLLERVIAGPDEELADKAREALQLPRVLRRRTDTPRKKISEEARVLAERSLEKGFLKDALKYLTVAHEADPVDFSVMLKLGWTLNMLKQDPQAMRWFDLARRSPDPEIARQADKAYSNLRPGLARFRTTTWMFPLYSSRWRDLFTYGQVKTEMKLGKLPFRPYLSTRFIGDVRGTTSTGYVQPVLLSESAVILGAGIATNYWKGLMGWAEAGIALGYLKHNVLPDYRGGLAFGRGWGKLLGAESHGLFIETNDDLVFVSRFGNDTLFSLQNRAGYTMPALSSLQTQLFWNGNLTADVQKQHWANFVEQGPGLRFRLESMPRSLSFTVSALRGTYLRDAGDGRRNFTDFRAGMWYAFTH